jgi:hypothetical protein
MAHRVELVSKVENVTRDTAGVGKIVRIDEKYAHRVVAIFLPLTRVGA